MTAQYLLRQSYRVKAGDTVLIHTAAGGLGTAVLIDGRANDQM